MKQMLDAWPNDDLNQLTSLDQLQKQSGLGPAMIMEARKAERRKKESERKRKEREKAEKKRQAAMAAQKKAKEQAANLEKTRAAAAAAAAAKAAAAAAAKGAAAAARQSTETACLPNPFSSEQMEKQPHQSNDEVENHSREQSGVGGKARETVQQMRNRIRKEEEEIYQASLQEDALREEIRKQVRKRMTSECGWADEQYYYHTPSTYMNSGAGPSTFNDARVFYNEMDELKRKIVRLEGEQRIERSIQREGDLEILRYDLRALQRRMDML